MKKWFVVQFIVLTTFTHICFADDDGAAPTPDIQMTATVKTSPVIQKVIQNTIVAYGTILPDADQITILSMPHAGLVENVWVRPGQKVRKGDLLFSLNASPGEKMTFLQAEASVEFAKQDLKRQEALLSQHLTTKAQVTVAKKALQDANIHLASLKKRGLGKSLQRFIALQDGIVIQVSIQGGQRVQADSTAIQIASDQQFVVRLGVEPEDLARLSVGQAVKIQSVFDREKPFVSKISQIHAMLNPVTHLVDVIVPIPSDQAQHYVIGSRLKGNIQTASHPALIIPRSAVLTDNEGSYVFSIQNGVAHRINIHTGPSSHAWVEVTQGLSAGNKVISHGNYELKPGMKIQKETKE